ncbi:hypothetical protein [Emcibacter sp.]|uniref:hypothetical protein n=1 Tax=Emcibacter sp. TaxID=1979954 RepID=UPI002AA82938|nr:hypothetical protein [Emcibacter sp.]
MFNWFRTSFRQLGVYSTFCYGTDVILRRLGLGSVYRYLYYAQPLDMLVKPARRKSAFDVIELKPGNKDLLEMLGQDVLDYRFKQNAVCLAALKEGKIAALLWHTAGPYLEDEVKAIFVPPANNSWDFGVHVEPEFRMTRAFMTLWSEGARLMTERGLENSLSRISGYNPNSILSHSRMGASEIGRATFLTIGPLQICWSSVSPRMDFTFGTKKKPVFKFSAPLSSPSTTKQP